MTDFAAERETMVERQLRRRGITEPLIVDAFRTVPREVFVDESQRQFAYGDHPLPIAAGQTISQPYIVALMIQAAELSPTDRVLEVGAGSGYAAAVMGQIAQRVVAVERHKLLAAEARERMKHLGYDNVAIVEGDGSVGWPAEAPFDAILAAASGRHVPQPLIDQLVPGGRIVMPIGDAGWTQQLIKVTKQANGNLDRENLGGVRFVPLIGAEGWTR